jgi:hypothetical protein
MTPLEILLMKTLIDIQQENSVFKQHILELEENKALVLKQISQIKEEFFQDINKINTYTNKLENENILLKKRTETAEKNMIELSELVNSMCELLQKDEKIE